MSSLQELGTAVRDRRSEMGLTQARLARLSGLSRATVNQLENGAVEDLSFNRASKLLNAIGLRINVSESHPRRTRPQRPRRKAVDLAAMSASVSYKTALAPQALRRALTAEHLSLDYAPQLFALVDEVPISLLAEVVEEIHRERGTARAHLWARLRDIAHALKSDREIWQ